MPRSSIILSSRLILSLSLILEGQLSVTGEEIYTIYFTNSFVIGLPTNYLTFPAWW